MANSHTKLNPIYAAIDAYQFNRAIKLASALPDSNVLGKALLAHSYTKAGQKHHALRTLHKILVGGEGTTISSVFFELQSVLTQQNELLAKSAASQSATPPKVEAPSGKKGKKGKKKPVPKVQQQQQRVVEESSSSVDLIDRLDVPPVIPETVDFLPNSSQSTTAKAAAIITDETTLATLAISLKALNLPMTAYQMYARAADMIPNELMLTKTFTSGLAVLATPSTWDVDSRSRIEAHVLGHMQTVSLQLARAAVSVNDNSTLMLATSWACQSALWQLEWLPSDDKRSLILPRLAESMALKLLQQENDKNQKSKEIRLLCIKILKRQSKWDDIVKILDETPLGKPEANQPPSEFGVAITPQQIKLETAEVMKKLERYEEAGNIYQAILESSPDDWLSWKAHLECCTLGNNGSVELTQSLANKAIKEREGSRHQLRGPHLALLEIAAEELRRNSNDENLRTFGAAIQEYATIFAPRAKCTMTDLDQYIDILLSQKNRDVSSSLLRFAESLRKSNASNGAADTSDKKAYLSKLRAYIFAVKLTHKLLIPNKDLIDEYLPDWKEIVEEWKTSLSFQDGEEQRELKPGDDLVLLAVQQLIFASDSENKSSTNNTKIFISAVLLESAIRNSPDNAYLKFLAIEVFHRLNATSHSWDLYQNVGIKHIQLDSCSFVIYPYLFEGGLYNEAIDVSTALLRFQRGAARDAGDFSGRAMNSGNLSKADEFMLFQREKMNQSLAFLYSKGMILDAAPLLATQTPRMKYDDNPLLKGGIGVTQGIVGGNDDITRATQMVVESHNQYAALSIVSCLDHCTKDLNGDGLSDNRDLSILNQCPSLSEAKIDDKQTMVRTSLRRGHVHGVLMRASLCLDSMKGPKKGKVVKPSTVLEKRTKSLLSSVEAASAFLENNQSTTSKGCYQLLNAALDFCRVLSIITAGLPTMDNGGDSTEQREERVVDMIRNHAMANLKKACDSVPEADSPQTVGSLLPSCILPVFVVLRMCSTACTAFGWGKRKTTKKVSVAMAEFSKAFQDFLADKMIPCLRALPSFETDSSTLEFDLEEAEMNLLDADVVTATKALVNQSQYRTRMRIEPILDEMISYLNEFDAVKQE